MATIKFMARQRYHLVPTLVCAIQFTLGTACLTINVSNFLATLFRQLFTLALVSLRICVTHFLLPIRMQKCPGVNTHNIFQSNLRIVACNSLNYLPVGIRCILRIIVRSSLNCPLVGIHHNLGIVARMSLSCSLASIRYNLRIAMHNFLNYPPVGIHNNLRITVRSFVSFPSVGIYCTLLLRSSNVHFLNKMIPMNARVLQRGLLFVATLALGSRPRQGVARLRAKCETREHSTCFRECKECEGMNPHTPK
jgi:hypothetical protein